MYTLNVNLRSIEEWKKWKCRCHFKQKHDDDDDEDDDDYHHHHIYCKEPLTSNKCNNVVPP
jgi:hypothetical protein